MCWLRSILLQISWNERTTFRTDERTLYHRHVNAVQCLVRTHRRHCTNAIHGLDQTSEHVTQKMLRRLCFTACRIHDKKIVRETQDKRNSLHIVHILHHEFHSTVLTIGRCFTNFFARTDLNCLTDIVNASGFVQTHVKSYSVLHFLVGLDLIEAMNFHRLVLTTYTKFHELPEACFAVWTLLFQNSVDDLWLIETNEPINNLIHS